jgi:hypothetical protein
MKAVRSKVNTPFKQVALIFESDKEIQDIYDTHNIELLFYTLYSEWEKSFGQLGIYLLHKNSYSDTYRRLQTLF